MSDLILSALISAGVSGLVAFTLREVIKATIQRRAAVEIENLKAQNNIEIERLKAELALAASTEREMAARRSLAYPKVVSLVYRIRNMARDLSKHLSKTNFSLVEEFGARTKDLEESLYEFRLDLERDHLFEPVHSYKNLALSFSVKASDVRYFLEHDEERRADNMHRELASSFQAIDELHERIVDGLSDTKTNKRE